MQQNLVSLMPTNTHIITSYSMIIQTATVSNWFYIIFIAHITTGKFESKSIYIIIKMLFLAIFIPSKALLHILIFFLTWKAFKHEKTSAYLTITTVSYTHKNIHHYHKTIRCFSLHKLSYD